MTSDRRVLVPGNNAGSVEHYYHFLLGYLYPVVRWGIRHDATRISVRDCGPMNSWWELLSDRFDVEVMSTDEMASRQHGRSRDHLRLPPLDHPGLFHGGALRGFAETLRTWGRVQVRPGEDIVIVERGPSDPGHGESATGPTTSGAARRSVPNMTEVAEALSRYGSVNVVDPAQMHPREQVAVFSSAGLVIGQHGAGLANMVWLPTGSSVVEIQPPLRVEVQRMFGSLAGALQLGYAVVGQAHRHSAVDPGAVAEAAASVRPPDPPGSRSRAAGALRRGTTRARLEMHRLRSR